MIISIRDAQEKDIQDMLRLLVQVDMVHHAARPDLFKGPATKYTREQLKTMIGRAEAPIFVCVDENDRLLGYCFCVYQPHAGDNVLTDILTLYIDDLCVDEAARGHGVGRALYEHAKAFAKDSGCYNLTLNVWAGNDSAHRFYEAMGMKPQKYGMETIL